MKPVVLFVHSNSELYGADFILLQTVVALKDVIEPIVAVPGEGPLTERLRAAGISYVLTRESVLRRAHLHPLRIAGFALRVLQDTWQLYRLVRRREVALVYSNTAAVVTGALAAAMSGRPHLFHIHEIIVSPAWFRHAVARFVTGTSKVVVAVSDAVRAHLLASSATSRTPIVTIRNGLNPDAFSGDGDSSLLRRELGADEGTVLFGVIGRIHPWKGQEVFVRAAALAGTRVPQARFVVIGGTFKGYESLVTNLQQLQGELGLSERLRILPHRPDVPALMRALDVFVLPSTLPDPLPTVVLEAMATSRTVIATDHGGAPEMVVHGETGLLVRPGDADSLAEAMVALADDSERRVAFGIAGRARMIDAFHRDRFHARLWQVLQDLMATHAPEGRGAQNPQPRSQ